VRGFKTFSNQLFLFLIGCAVLLGQAPTREYIRMGDRVVATEKCSTVAGFAGWLSCGIGNTDQNNSATYASGELTVTARGGGFGAASDNGFFVFQSAPLIGNGTLYARVVNGPGANAPFNAAIMFRSGLLPGDTDVYLTFTGNNLLQFQQRATENGTVSTVSYVSAPAQPSWLKMVWTGSSITAYTSLDGSDWTQIGNAVTFSASQLYAGVAVNGLSTATASAAFDEILITTTTADFYLEGPVTIPGYSTSSVGGATTEAITISSLNSFGSNVSFTASGLPPGVSYSFSPATITGSGSTYLSLSVPPNVVAGSYPFTITAVSGSLVHTAGPTLVISNSNYSGQPGWLMVPIGNTDPNNTASFSTGMLNVSARGGGIGGTSDNFFFVYQATPLTGDGAIYARLVNKTAGNAAFNSAIMLRSGLEAWDTDIFLTFSGSNVLDLDRRATEGGTTTNLSYQTPPALPSWMKLVRSGTVVTAYVSLDGVNWTQVGSPATFTAPQLYAGIAVNGTSSATAASVFTDVLVTTTASDFYLIGPPSTIPGYSTNADSGARTDPIVISGLNGFSGTVSLAVSGLPSGVNATLTPSTITTSGTAYLTLTLPVGMASGSYPFTITGTSASAAHETGAVLSVLPSNFSGQSGWLVTAINDSDSNFSLSSSSGTFSVTAGNGNISGTSDSFEFIFQEAPLIAGGTLVARLDTCTTNVSSFRCGVLLRSGPQPWDTNVFVAYESSQVVTITSRTSEKGSTSNQGTASGQVLPKWLKLAWDGSTITVYRSTDGVNWTQTGTNITLPAPQLYGGIAVIGTSSSNASATFDSVTTQSN
jgi:hypothetical protein